MNEWDKYKGREQSCVKHYILKTIFTKAYV